MPSAIIIQEWMTDNWKIIPTFRVNLPKVLITTEGEVLINVGKQLIDMPSGPGEGTVTTGDMILQKVS